LERRKSDHKDLLAAIAAKDPEVLKRVGHQLKGNAATFGYSDLEQIGRLLEQCGLMGDFDCAHHAVEALGSWIYNQDRKAEP
jgi:HPt (histidine-containing phosphotransfer) domain-containing protein